MNQKASGILLDISYSSGEQEESLITLFVKTSEGIQRFVDPAFRPYLYLTAKNPRKVMEYLNAHPFPDGSRIIGTETVTKSSHENAVKVVFRNTVELSNNRPALKKIDGVLRLFESDILYPKRFLLDHRLSPLNEVEVEFTENNGRKEIHSIASEPGGPLQLNLLAFDLETLAPGRFSDPSQDPILTIGVAATGVESVVFTYGKGFEGQKNVKVCSDEKETIEAFISFVQEFAPDGIVTYNGDSFDFPYLKTRCEKYGLKLGVGHGKSEPSQKKISIFNAQKLRGVQHVDAFQIVKFLARMAVITSPKLDLESVVKHVFGFEKEKLPVESINEIWNSRKNTERLIQYNREDTEFTLKLANQFLPLFIELGRITQQTLFDATRSTSSVNVESIMMQEALARGALIPTKPSSEEAEERNQSPIQGGYVREPVQGLHERIAVLDFRSLYPSIIISHNISPETLNCPHASCVKGSNQAPEENTWFCEQEKGLIPSVLARVLEKRIEVKKKMKAEKDPLQINALNAQQHVLKILLNSSYGALIYPRFRWYCRECGQAATAWGRHYVKKVMEEAEQNGFRTLYGDTDSAMLQVPAEKEKKDIEAFVERINAKLTGSMELEFKGFYRRGLFVSKKSGGAAKKKYALMGFDGKMEVVGFESVRRDWAILVKELQRKVLEAVLAEGDPQKALEEVRRTVKRLQEGKVSKKELVIMTQLRRQTQNYQAIGPHVAAVRKAESEGKKFSTGSLIEFIITRSGKSISDRARLSESVKEGDYDSDYYIHHQVLPAVEKIFEELGYRKEDLLHGGKQSSLFSFEGH
ncbi:MAG: ribonuclease H-like domain-containing protein [Candidatus Diapherotrites archaeon]|nr:ribonuclease H-like domain-containing protein [Candidatus Diapherotrites archaeon]